MGLVLMIQETRKQGHVKVGQQVASVDGDIGAILEGIQSQNIFLP